MRGVPRAARERVARGQHRSRGEPSAAARAAGAHLADQGRGRASRRRRPRRSCSRSSSRCSTRLRRRARAETRRRSFDEIWAATELLDRLGLYTTEVYQKSREEVIARQQQEMLELSTPVVKLWDGVLALPLIGTLDSARTQVVMESLLQRIVDTGADDRDHRHHRRAHRRHAGRAAPAEDGRRGAADGRRLHHQRHPPADRADHRAPRRRARRGHDQGDAGRRVRARAATRRTSVDARRRARADAESRPMERIPILKMGEFLLVTSRSTCTTGWR